MQYLEASSVTDAILPRIAAGDTAAVDDCLRQYSNLVWSLARRMSFNQNDAEDAVQEIFIDIWKSAGRFDPDRAPESVFVTTIARRRLIDRQRRSSRQPAFEPFYETVPNGNDVDEEATRQLQMSRVTEALKDLPAEQQRVMTLAVVQGLTHSQIADATGLPLGTVKSHIRRGLLKLENLLKLPRSREVKGVT
jgi:RNA polymerase sigma-70 factor (ECF subfamily)